MTPLVVRPLDGSAAEDERDARTVHCPATSRDIGDGSSLESCLFRNNKEMNEV